MYTTYCVYNGNKSQTNNKYLQSVYKERVYYRTQAYNIKRPVECVTHPYFIVSNYVRAVKAVKSDVNLAKSNVKLLNLSVSCEFDVSVVLQDSFISNLNFSARLIKLS
jgi:hypothetical protein